MFVQTMTGTVIFRNGKEKTWRVGHAILLFVIIALMIWIGLRISPKEQNEFSKIMSQPVASEK